MNAARRKQIQKVYDAIEELSTALEEIQADENEYRDNIPENLQGSERYERAEEACDSLGSAASALSEALESLESAME